MTQTETTIYNHIDRSISAGEDVYRNPLLFTFGGIGTEEAASAIKNLADAGMIEITETGRVLIK